MLHSRSLTIAGSQNVALNDPKNETFYEELPHKDSIRILEIKSGSPDDPVICSLRDARLSDHVSFEALSYVWGSPQEKLQRIKCNGQSFDVRPNLYHALRRLRLPDKSRFIWADAICIDQHNPQERGHQVSHMGQIYKRAGGVLIWLGIDPDAYAERVFRGICRYVNDWRPDKAENERATFSISKSFPAYPPSNPQGDLRSWKPTAKLYMSPWFSRIWVIQEAALASSATVVWGDCEIAWRWVGMAVTDYELGELLGQDAAVGIRNANLIYKISQAYYGEKDRPAPSRSFLDLLKMARKFEASDPRDKVYGLLGLRTSDNDPETGRLFIEPDYTISFEELLQRTASRAIENSGTLELLSSVQHPPNNSNSTSLNVPSWVPQWDKEFTTLLLSDRDFKVSRNVLKQRKRTIKIDNLPVEAISISRVTKVFPLISTLESIGQYQDLHKLLHTNEHLSLLCRTLTAGKKTHTSLYRVTRGPEVELKQHIYNIPREAHPKMLQLIKMRPRDPGVDYKNGLREWFAPCIGRRLFVCENGLLGLGPAVMKEGDVVHVLEGVNVPFVLRSQGESVDDFWLVGEAFVEGLMEGEGVDAVPD